MELANIEIRVPKEMKTFLLNEDSADELRRNALIFIIDEVRLLRSVAEQAMDALRVSGEDRLILIKRF